MRMVVIELADNANHSLPPGERQGSRIRRGTSRSRDRTLVADEIFSRRPPHPHSAIMPGRRRCGPTLAGMATESTMLALGTPAPPFSLPEPATGVTVSLDELSGPALVVTYPQDGPDQMVAEARRHDWTFPYLYDETQDVARAFNAACTPDTFVFDGERRLVYRGQLDDSRPRNDLPVTAADVRAAVDAVLAGRPVDPDQRPSIGCGIKWR